MKITKLKLKNFKKFAEKQLEFKPGLNIVLGKNEHGKSTIASALLEAMYGDPTSHSQKFKREFASWQSPGNVVVEMDMEIEGKKFSMLKDFTDHRFLLEDHKTGKKYDNFKTIGPKFFARVGISTRALYQSTAWFSNHDLTHVHEVKSLGEAVKQAIVGIGGVNADGALKKLSSALTDLNKGLHAPAKTPGVIKYLQDEVAQKEAELGKIRAQVEKLKSAVILKKSSGSKIGELEEKIKTQEQELKSYDDLKAAEKDIKGIGEKGEALERDIQEVQRIQKDQQDKQKEFDGFAHFVKMDMDKLEARLAAVRLERDKLETGVKNAKDVSLLEQDSPKFGLADGAIAVGGLVIGVVLGLLVGLVVGLLVGLGGIIGSLAYYGMRWSGHSVKVKNARVAGEKAQKEIFKNISDLKNVEDGLLKKAGAGSFEEFAAARARYESLKLSKKELGEALSGYLSGRTLQDMEKEQLELFTKKKEIETTKMTDQVLASKMSENEYYKKRSDLDMLRLDLRDLTAAKGKSEGRVEDAEVSIDDVSRLEEEIAEMKSELAHYNKKSRVLAHAKLGIDEARDEMVSSSSEFIKSGVEKCISQVTDGKYKQIRISPDLKIDVYSEEKSDWIVPEESLSRGSIDQVYLSFRLALLEVVSEGKPVPIVMDDPFLTFDEERLASTRKMLETWAKQHQIFLFSTRSEYKDWGNLVKI